MSKHLFTDGVKAREFMTAGRARVTIVITQAVTRYTYRITRSSRRKNDSRPPVHFVSLLNGPDNEVDYVFLGTIFRDGMFRYDRRSDVGKGAPSLLTFQWVWNFVRRGELPPLDAFEVWHEGLCGRCGRGLTVPDSISSGIGPVCAGKKESKKDGQEA